MLLFRLAPNGGISLQISDPYQAHDVVRHWLDTSRTAGAPWILTVDEIGPWWRGIDPDTREDLNNQDSVRALTLWASLLAGGAGVEWYFGAYSPHNDLGLEDWRSRDRVWEWTNNALDFFQQQLPFTEMDSHDELVGEGGSPSRNPGRCTLSACPLAGRRPWI